MANSNGIIGRLRAAARARPELWEAGALAVIGIALTAIGLNGVWSSLTPLSVEGDSRWLHLLAILPACAALLAKSRHPMLVLAVVGALFAGDLLLGGSVAMLLIFWDALYAAAYFGSATARTWLLRIIATAIVALTVIAGFPDYELQLTVFFALQTFALIGTPYWWATAVRQKSELADLAQQRADDLHRLAELRETQIVREERGRMARDLHDVVAGQISAIAIHSEAALARPAAESGDRAALRAVRAASVQGLDDMRSMIDLLRSGREPAETVGGLERLESLVAAARRAGLVVETAPGALPILPAIIDQAAARILQESLTNAVRHTRNGSATVDVRLVDDRVVLRVTSSGDRPGATSADRFAGIGIATMSERAAAIGGTLTAGPTDASRNEWTVAAELPIGGPS